MSATAGAAPVLAVSIGLTSLFLMSLFFTRNGGEHLPVLLCLLFFDYLFVCHATFRTRDFTEASIDGQVIGRVTIAVCLLAYLSVLYLFNSAAFRQSLMQTATWTLALFVSIGAIYSLTPQYTFVCGVMYLSVTITTIVLCNLIGPLRTFALVCYSMSALMIASGAQLLLFAEQAYIIEYVAGGGFVERFRGLFLHPVQLGNGLAPIVIYYVYIQQQQGGRVSVGLVGWGCAALVAFIMILEANSRVSLVSLVISCAFLLVARYRWVAVLGLSFLVISMIVILAANFNAVARAVTRSGDVSELFTFTGRTDVWAFAWPLITEAPLLGYGYGSTRVLFQDLPAMLGWTASHAHNMWLQGILEVGVLGVLIMMAPFVSVVLAGMRLRNALLGALALQLLVRSATEVVLFFYIPGVSTALFAIAVALTSRGLHQSGRETSCRGGHQRQFTSATNEIPWPKPTS